MRTFKAKLAALLMAVGCFLACFGVGVAVMNPATPSVTVSAATTHPTITGLTPLASSTTTGINAYPTREDKPGVNSWDYAFTFVEGTGEGFLWNGETFTGWELKQPGTDFFINLGSKEATEGDILTIDGTFYNATADVNFVFHNCGLKYNGSGWESYTPLSVDNVTTLAPANGCTSSVVYAYPKTAAERPSVKSWGYAFTFVESTGSGICLDGEKLTSYELKQPGDFYISLGKEAAAGSILTLDGTFRNETLNTNIVFKNSALKYNGSAWETYTPPTVHNIGALVLHVNSSVGGASGANNVLYLMRKDGGALPVLNWNITFTYVSGGGFKVGETQKTPAAIKSTGDGFYWEFEAVAADTIISISGTFFCEAANVEYVIAESQFQWTGSGWKVYTPPTVYTITTLAPAGGCTTSSVNAYPKNESKPAVNDWDRAFTFVEGSGSGIYLGNTKLTDYEVKQPGDFFINIKREAVEGDVLKLDGTFRNEELNTNIVFKNSALKYTNSGWKTYTWPTVHNIGELVLHVNSSVGGASGAKNVLYLQRADEGELPIKLWENPFVFENGDGFRVNGNPATLNEMQSTGDGLYFAFAELSAGDIVSIGGTFFCEKQNVEYVIAESQFQWTGSGWKVYTPPTVYTITTLAPAGGCTTSSVNAYPKNESKPAVNDWDRAFTFVEGSGSGIYLGNTKLTDYEVKQPGDFFINIKREAVEGDVLKLDGTFRNEELNTNIVFKNSALKYTNSGWKTYTWPTVHNIGELVLHVNSSVGGASGAKNVLYLQRADEGELPIKLWENPFVFENGDGFRVNGEPATLNEMQSTGDGLYFAFAELSAGDIVSIGGTFFCEKQNVEYVIAKSQFQWTGSMWQVYVPPIEHTVYNLGPVFATNDSNAGAVYVWPTSDEGFEKVDGTWTEKLTFLAGSGVGVTLNGTQIAMDDIKIPGQMYIALGTTASEGDIVVIGGTFYNDNLKVKYVIDESQFQWTGSAWEKYTPPTHTTYELGPVFATNDSTASAVYVWPTSDEGFEKVDGTWTEKLTFLAGSGVGVTLNGAQIAMDDIKIPGQMYIALGTTASEGDIVVIGGTFYNDNLKVKYVIEESKFQFNGEKWVAYEEPTAPVIPGKYNTINLGALTFRKMDDDKKFFYFNTQTAVVNGEWNAFVLESGIGIKFNNKNVGAVAKFPECLFIDNAGYGKAPVVGDILVIGGTFYNEELRLRYIVPESRFMFIEGTWCKYDEVSLVDLGLEAACSLNKAEYNRAGSSYAQTTNTGTALRFGYKSENVAAGEISIRLRGENWAGYHFRITSGKVEYVDSISTSLSSNTYYEIEIGAIDVANTQNVFVYIKINGALKASTTVEKTAAYNTNSVSIYASENVVNTTLTDINHFVITYTTSKGTVFTDYASKGYYELKPAKTYNTCIGWIINGKLYQVGDVLTGLSGNITAEALEVDFTLEDGAAIRLNDTADQSGIRFTAFLKQADLDKLVGNYGITSVSYGMLIIPFDYLGAGQAPNLEDFTAGENILKIVSTTHDTDDGYIKYRGAMQKLFEANYERLFAGRGYMEITLEGGKVITVYTNFDIGDNVRSVRSVAQKFKADTEPSDDGLVYSELNANKKAVADVYAASEGIKLMNYEAYKANNVFDVMAWYYPELDESNAYYNDTNIAIAQKLKDTGVTTVYLDGAYHLDLTTQTNIDKTRQIINFFWSQGLKTIAYGSNSQDKELIGNYSTTEFPDFSDCEGFVGFLVWDEPYSNSYSTLATFAQNFEKVYAGTDVTFMTNLFPSYATIFDDNSDFTAYLQAYCDTVLSQVQGEKWLSLDTYPIYADKTLGSTFLYDLAMLKYYAENNGAHAHVALQSSGWTENGNTSKNRMPTEAEMRMQAYAAMAFGIDSISWWSYSDMRKEDQDNPTDNDDYYTRFANVNNELAAISCVYSAFEWKGVILGMGKNNQSWGKKDNDYEAYNAVNGKIGNYLLGKSNGNTATSYTGTVSNITGSKHLASISTNQTAWNYLMSVMEDANGNEGYVLCNYNSHEAARAQTITITFSSNITEVVIYRGGVAETVKVSDKTLTVDLTTGEGVIILPSKLG